MTKWLVAAALVLALLACSPESQTGSLVLILSAPDVASRIALPELDMNIHHFELSGTGPGGVVYEAVPISGGVNVVEGLVAGDWTIVVEAFNDDVPDAVLIGRGSTTVEILPRDIVSAEVEVAPLPGSGTLTVTVSWLASATTDPGLVVSLTDLDGGTVAVTSTSGTNPVVLVWETLGVGYYDLTVQLSDAGVPLWGAFEVVRILAGQPTEVGLAAPLSDLGDLTLTVTEAMEKHIEVSLSGSTEDLGGGTVVTATASAPGYTGLYAWYLDGALVPDEDGYELVLGPGGFAEGTHRIDVRVMSGTVAGSASWSFVE